MRGRLIDNVKGEHGHKNEPRTRLSKGELIGID
jgi:hypothetical protein